MGDSDEWKRTVYFDEDIGVYIPAMNLEAAFIEGSKQFKVTGRATATKFIKSGLFINDDKLQLLVDNKPIVDLDKVSVDRRTVKNPATKMRNTRYRAIFHKWSISFLLTISSDDYISTELLRDIIVYSGMYVGLCDYRPRFGRFKLVSIKEVE